MVITCQQLGSSGVVVRTYQQLGSSDVVVLTYQQLVSNDVVVMTCQQLGRSDVVVRTLMDETPCICSLNCTNENLVINIGERLCMNLRYCLQRSRDDLTVTRFDNE